MIKYHIKQLSLMPINVIIITARVIHVNKCRVKMAKWQNGSRILHNEAEFIWQADKWFVTI